jgi:3-oxoadipate enol-lactonase
VPLLDTAAGPIEFLVTGAGAPITVFAHGVGATIAETRPLGSGVRGSRVFFHFRGHGRSATPRTGWDYRGFAADLRAVSDAFRASRAVGVSLGAAALVRMLADTPDRFERVVFFLPAVLDRPRDDAATARLPAIAAAIRHGDEGGLADLLVAELPAGVRDRPDVLAYTRGRAAALLTAGIAAALTELARSAPLRDRTELAAVTAPALVVGQQGDDVHPVWVAEELAAALPAAQLHVFTEAGALWLARRRLREVVAGFLNAA